MTEARPELEALGAQVVAVGGSADFQARGLRDAGCPYPLLLDPAQQVRRAVDLGRLSWLQLLSLQGVVNYLRAFRRARPGAIGRAEAALAPGVVITDRDLRVVWVHRGRSFGDYPRIADVLDQLRQMR